MPQRPIGPYIADFYCASAKLVVEMDGKAHFTPEGQAYDAERTPYLEGLGLCVVRFSNADVMSSGEDMCWQIGQELTRAVER
nr:endonuclease domain-containing protein [uncultured Meiothermus sp.]